MYAHRYSRKMLMEAADCALSALPKSDVDIDIESAVEKAKQMGFEAVCQLLSENIARRGQLRNLKERLSEQIDILGRTLEQDVTADPIEVRHLIDEFRKRYNDVSLLLPRYEEIVPYILEAWYEAEVARSVTKKELQERIASYQRILDCSNKADTMDEAAKLIPLYKEALGKLESEPSGHSTRVMTILDVELDDLSNALKTIDLKSDPVEMLQLHNEGPVMREHRAKICQERCSSEILWWQELKGNTNSAEANYFVSEFTKRYERASDLLPKYREIVNHFVFENGKRTVSNCRSRDELQRNLEVYQRKLDELNDKEDASQVHKDQALIMIQLYKEALSNG